jgi:hypothetical protein
VRRAARGARRAALSARGNVLRPPREAAPRPPPPPAAPLSEPVSAANASLARASLIAPCFMRCCAKPKRCTGCTATAAPAPPPPPPRPEGPGAPPSSSSCCRRGGMAAGGKGQGAARRAVLAGSRWWGGPGARDGPGSGVCRISGTHDAIERGRGACKLRSRAHTAGRASPAVLPPRPAVHRTLQRPRSPRRHAPPTAHPPRRTRAAAWRPPSRPAAASPRRPAAGAPWSSVPRR